MAKIFLFRTKSDKLKYGNIDNINNCDVNQAIVSTLLDKGVHNEYVDEVDPQQPNAFKDIFVIMLLEKEVFIKDRSLYIGSKFE